MSYLVRARLSGCFPEGSSVSQGILHHAWDQEATMKRRITTRRRTPRRGVIVRDARVVRHHTTVRPAYRPTQRQVVAIRALADHALAESEAGRTISFRDVAAELGITLDEEGRLSGSHAGDI